MAIWQQNFQPKICSFCDVAGTWWWEFFVFVTGSHSLATMGGLCNKA
jgi:hypothetical protein